MFERNRVILGWWAPRQGSGRSDRRGARPRLEGLESRDLPATLAPIPNVQVPQYMGYQLPLEGGAGNAQTYTVTSSNPNIKPSIAQGQFWTVNVSHTSSGGTDPSFNGSLTFQLFEDLTPLTTSRIETLINQGFYTNKNFHRIASGFPDSDGYIVQGGSVNGSGSGEVNQPGFPFPDEFVQQLAFTSVPLQSDPNSIYSVAGQLAMANAGDDTNSSQFFVTTENPRFLDYEHTIFGQLVAGQQTLRQMTQVALSGTTPVNPITITGTSLAGTSADGVVHIDTSTAGGGQSGTITVTAFDPTTNTTTTQTFQVTVTDNKDASGTTIQEQPFLSPLPQNQVVGLIKTTAPVQGQTAVFQLQSVSPNPPGTTVQYIVRGGVSNGAFTNVTNATATVDANGVVRVTPTAGFTGVINLLVGVGGPNASTSTVGDWDTQAITLTVNGGPEVNLPPIALSGTSTAVLGTPSQIQLSGDTANPNSQQTLSFEIVTFPSNGTVSSFDASTGQFIYTPNPGFQGTDTLTFRVRDVGNPTPNLASANVATQTILVGGGNTGAVRLIDDVLVVSAPPRRDSVPNTIRIRQTTDGKVVAEVNGLLDAIQPFAEDLTKLVVYGSKTDDNIIVESSVTVPSTIDGGRGGTNTIQASGATSRGHVWFGQNRYTGGPQTDRIIGRAGQFRVRSSGGADVVFAGMPKRRATLHRRALPPAGTFYRLINGVLVKRPTPSASTQPTDLVDSGDDGTVPGLVNSNRLARLRGDA